MSSRSLLQQWIQPPERTKATEPKPNEHSKSLPASKIDKKVSQQRWGDIFKKPAKHTTNNAENSTKDAPSSGIDPRETDPQQNSANQLENEEYNGFSRPSYMHTFKVAPTSLGRLKPKVHSFFAKRNTTVTPITSAKLVKHVERHAPFALHHIRPHKTWEHRRVTKRAKPGRKSPDNTFSLGGSVPGGYIPAPIHPSRRMLQSTQQLQSVAAFHECNEFAEMCSQPSLFDQGEFEYRMWCEKYQPRSSDQHVSPESTNQVKQWLAKQFKTRSKTDPKQRRRKLAMSNSFVVDDDFDENATATEDVLVVYGATGTGKTSAVYAACSSLNAFVFEVSTAAKRTGKELNSVLEGISQNHAVHNAKDVVILVDDSDIVYENEAGSFWPTISRFAANSRRPVVLTTTNPNMIALSAVEAEFVGFNTPSGVRVMDIAWSIALAEGHLLDKTRVAKLVVEHKADLRRILTELQFWCQMGIGGHPSGSDWAPRESENGRVISQTWFPVSEPVHGSEQQQQQQQLEKSEGEPFITCQRAPPEETVWIGNAIHLPEWYEPVILPQRGNEYQLFKSLPYGTVDLNTRTIPLACDISPYLRYMAAADYRRASSIQQILRRYTPRESRLMRRTWSSQGYDTRNYLELPLNLLEQIIKAGLQRFEYLVNASERLPMWFIPRETSTQNSSQDSQNSVGAPNSQDTQGSMGTHMLDSSQDTQCSIGNTQIIQESQSSIGSMGNSSQNGVYYNMSVTPNPIQNPIQSNMQCSMHDYTQSSTQNSIQGNMQNSMQYIVPEDIQGNIQSTQDAERDSTQDTLQDAQDSTQNTQISETEIYSQDNI